MTNLEKLKKCKEYYKIINNTVKSNSKKDKNIFVKLLNALSQNIYTILGLTLGIFLGCGFALLFIAKLTLPIAFCASLGAGLTIGVGIPKLLDFIAMKSKTTFGLKYSKKFMNNYFKEMKAFVSNNYKKMLNAESLEDLSEEELNDFINQTNIFAKKYHCYLNKMFGKKIKARNNADYKKIEKLSSKIDGSNKAIINKKIEKIIKSNNKFTDKWCEAFNDCGRVAKNLYMYASEMNNKFEIPDDKYFLADKNYLNKKVKENISLKALTERPLADGELNNNVTFETTIKSKSSTRVQKESLENNM